MFKKIGKALKSVGRQAERNIKSAGKFAESNVRGAKSMLKGDLKGALSSAKKSAGIVRGAATGTAKNTMRTGRDFAGGNMTMGMLDKMRAETGQTAAIPREAMAEGAVKSAAEKYNEA